MPEAAPFPRPAGLPRHLFVTGTDTGVGKTLVSALVCRALSARYWKPVQTGTQDGDDDTALVAELAALPPERLHPPARRYAAPASPQWAAALEGERVTAGELRAAAPALSGTPLVVEGAGGVLVPIAEQETMLDLMHSLGLPALVVARSGLGTVNHTLLTLGALRGAGLPVAGVVLSGPPAPHNAAAIEEHAGVPVLAQLPPLPQVTPQAVAAAARQHFGPLTTAGGQP